ncbi:MAG: hypothetical protein S4CHLAM45_08940 [Chlamydiales bacterium]|nr:hypothetical protein [Chlamydiales bacterium]MCH9620554.1 hypothetical protein [Chlamydiales bacterium]MCH9622998.1 hypothetical protein [Chlamydiales bacterium]
MPRNLLLITLAFVGISFSVEKDIPLGDQRQIELLFKYLLFAEDPSFGYTLLGKKPISINSIPKRLPIKSVMKNPSIIILPSQKLIHPIFSIFSCWKTWERYQKYFSTDQYSFFAEERKDTLELYLINKKEVLSTITMHLSLFQEKMGKECSASEIMDKILAKEGFLWNRLGCSNTLYGILLGYGKENSIAFENYSVKKAPLLFPGSSVQPERLQQIALPYFVCFSEKESEHLIKDYKKQREQIICAYKDKDVLSFTLKCLTKHSED